MKTLSMLFVLSAAVGSQFSHAAVPVNCFDVKTVDKCPTLKKSCSELLKCSSENRKNPECAVNAENFDIIFSKYSCKPCLPARDAMRNENEVCQKGLAQASKPIPPGCAPNDLEFPAFTQLGIGCDLALKNCPCTYEPCSQTNLPYPPYQGYTTKDGTKWAFKKTGSKIVAGKYAGQDEYQYCMAKLCAKNQPEAVSCVGPLWK